MQTTAQPLGSASAQTSGVCGTCLLASSGCKNVSAKLLSPCTRSAVTAILQISAPNTLGVQVLTTHPASLGYTSRPVEQVARHLFLPRLSCFHQVGDSCLPSTHTRLTPNDEEECEIVELNMCIISCKMLRAWREVPNSPWLWQARSG